MNRKLTDCTPEKFATYYPFFPYQVTLIPSIVRSLRSKGGRGEQLSGSTRTLLAITQDVLRAGRRRYLDVETGPMVSFACSTSTDADDTRVTTAITRPAPTLQRQPSRPPDRRADVGGSR